MNKILNFLKKIITFKNNTVVPPDNIKKGNTLSFMVDENESVQIIVSFDNDSKKSSKNFGIFLNQLTNGEFNQSILEVMSKTILENPYYGEFVKNAFYHWLFETYNTDPIIKPSQFNNYSLTK